MRTLTAVKVNVRCHAHVFFLIAFSFTNLSRSVIKIFSFSSDVPQSQHCLLRSQPEVNVKVYFGKWKRFKALSITVVN